MSTFAIHLDYKVSLRFTSVFFRLGGIEPSTPMTTGITFIFDFRGVHLSISTLRPPYLCFHGMLVLPKGYYYIRPSVLQLLDCLEIKVPDEFCLPHFVHHIFRCILVQSGPTESVVHQKASFGSPSIRGCCFVILGSKTDFLIQLLSLVVSYSISLLPPSVSL